MSPQYNSKPYTCLAGYGDPIFVAKEVQAYVLRPCCRLALTSESSESDYEVELVIVIGKECRDVPAEQAHEVIAGVRDMPSSTPPYLMMSSVVHTLQ